MEQASQLQCAEPAETDVSTTPSFAEFAGIEHILLADLRSLLSEPLTGQSRLWIEKLLDMLLDLLSGQFAAEEADGYLQDVLDNCPEFRGSIQKLRRQHEDLSQSLAQLRAELNESHLAPRQAAKVRSGLRAWMDRLQSHQDAEMRLLQLDGTHTALAS